MTKEFFPFFSKNFAPTFMQSKKSLECILDKKKAMTSDRAKGKPLHYKRLKISEYLTPIEYDLSMSEERWLLKYRIEYVEVG